jgi:hypothetical protein
MSAEHARLEADTDGKAAWKKWGPYLSERQWGTVREDYSESGNAWDYFSHDQARSRAYRWGEDGLAGISDNHQQLCFALALWNGKDPILKERLFGLTNSEANHGEDVKEYYFYLDSTPTHSYMKYLYKYPQAAFPYGPLVEANKRRGRLDFEYELIDTGVFDDDRYFDVFVEYAKASPEDLLIAITVHNRGSDAASLHVLPTIWFRNTWSWGGSIVRPELSESRDGTGVVALSHPVLGRQFFYADGAPSLLFTENETNNERLFHSPNKTPYVKDGINDFIVKGRLEAINPEKKGTKAAAHYEVTVPPGGSHVVRLRLCDLPPAAAESTKGGRGAFSDFGALMETRSREADEFYATVIPASMDADQGCVMRQALAGMLWTKQYFNYDVDRWLSERGADPFRPSKHAPRNEHWHHMRNAHIISMPDKWEYPWYAAWDLAFHVLALTLVDEEFGKKQLELMLSEEYLHPSGQIPAYEWNFGDVNPPVHAWSTIFTHRLMKRKNDADVEWLERSFHKLLLNFTWWVNRKDPTGRNAFEGGFLGLDNIGVFDRSAPLPTGGRLEQADGTAWMALFCQNMLEIAMELTAHNPAYADMCEKFITHYLWIASAMANVGQGTGMWDEEDGFFYDVLRTPDGRAQRLKVRSMVGLLPLCATTVYESGLLAHYPQMQDRMRGFLKVRPELTEWIHDPTANGYANRRLASVLREDRLRRVLSRMLDENEFLGPHGIRALSRYHEDHPYVFRVGNQDYSVKYLPAESDSGMFGGNSNWRGPVWMPVNGLILRALLQYYAYYGETFTIECPTGSGRMMNLYQVAEEIGRRLAGTFLRDKRGRRPVYGGCEKFQTDPHWRDLILFYEYFHGDNGAGLGASHQTGWTGIIARIMHLFATTSAEQVLKSKRMVTGAELERVVRA